MIKWIFAILVIILSAAFAALNSNTVEINYIFGHVSLYFPLLVVLVFTFGLIAGFFISIKINISNRLSDLKIKQPNQYL